MLRTALRPRWLALLAVVLLVASAMARLGEWQLSRARESGQGQRREQAARPPVPLTELLRARQTFPGSAADRRVTTAGTWDGDRQLLVAGRRLGDATGFWVLTPLRLPDGSAVPVVRGWVASPGDPAASAAALPAGRVEVDGVLRPAEPAAERAPGQGSGLPDGQVERIVAPQLVQRWPYPLLTGYVVATAQRPVPPGPAPAPVRADPPSGGELDLRNLSYALQWWLFAAFGLFFWWRIVRDDHRGRAAEPSEAVPSGPPPAREGDAVPTPDRGARP